MQSPPAISAGLIVRQTEPLNLESPFSPLEDNITPPGLFYVRNHFPAPDEVQLNSWRLRIDGSVTQPIELSYDELRQLPAFKRTVTLECAGNGRVFLKQQAPGVQWGLGGVSTADWTGVPLTTILELVGVSNDAIELVLQGADQGQPSETPRPSGNIHFAHGIPLAKARGDVLLAYEMNGVALERMHGFPVRAIVPGWYAMASVKWLERITVVDRPFQGYFQTVDYAYWDQRNGMPIRTALSEMQVKSQIARPIAFEVIARDTDYRIFGAAWCGTGLVDTVEISTDGGKTFAPASLLGEPQEYVWRRWEYHWHAPSSPGQVTILSRATDSRGKRQPIAHDPNFGGYVIHHTLPVGVTIS